ncbi:MAG: glycosyltransferase [Bacteroides sp.]|nr:glycosyltransferase [Bacteroides sp.]
MIGLFNDCFPPIMDGVSVTTSNYAYWLDQKRGDVRVVTPQAPAATDNNNYPVYRYLSLPIPMRKPYRLGFPCIDWPFHKQTSKVPFELVHAHCPFSSGNIARSIAHNKHIPLIATFRSKYRSDFERIIPNRYMIEYLIRNIVSFYEQADEAWIPQASVEETLREYGYKGKVEIVDNGVVREAAALHTPSLLLQGSAAAEIISDGVNGFLSTANEERYADTIAHLLAHPQRIETAGTCAAGTLARSWQDIAEEVNDRYNHLIKRYVHRSN